MMYRRLRGYRYWLDKDGRVQAISPLLERKPVYRPRGWQIIAALVIWVVLIGLVTAAARW